MTLWPPCRRAKRYIFSPLENKICFIVSALQYGRRENPLSANRETFIEKLNTRKTSLYIFSNCNQLRPEILYEVRMHLPIYCLEVLSKLRRCDIQSYSTRSCYSLNVQKTNLEVTNNVLFILNYSITHEILVWTFSVIFQYEAAYIVSNVLFCFCSFDIVRIH